MSPEPQIVQKLIQTAAEIAVCNFQWRFVSFLIFHTSFAFKVKYFIRTYQKPIVIQKKTNDPLISKETKQFIIFSANASDLNNKLAWLSKHQFDNTGKYIIICYSEKISQCDENEVMGLCWKYKIINIVYLTYNIDDYNIRYTTYYPFMDGKCENSEPVSLTPMFQNGCPNFFPRKCYNLHSCVTIVSTLLQPPFFTINAGKPVGMDGELLLLIIEAINSTLVLMTPKFGNGWGLLHEDGNWTGSLGDLYNDIANFSMTSGVITYSRYKTFQMSKEYNALDMVWVTSPAKLKPQWQKLFRPFTLEVHCSIIVIFCIILAVDMFLKTKWWEKVRYEMKMEQLTSSVLFHSWMTFMGLPVNSLPKKSILSIIVLMWILFCFIIRTIYEVALIDALKDNVFYPNFENIEDAIKNQYPLGGVPSIKDYFVDDPLIFNNWVDLNSTDIEPTMLKLSDGKQFVLAVSKEFMKLFLKQYQNRRLQIIPNKIINSPTVIFFKKYSPLVESINIILLRLTEAGFTQKIYKRYTSRKIIYRIKENEPIKLQHYTGCYFLLFLGYILSAILFNIELYCAYNMRK